MGPSWERFPARNGAVALTALVALYVLPSVAQGSMLLLGRLGLLFLLGYHVLEGVAVWSKLVDKANLATAETHRKLHTAMGDGSRSGHILASPYYDIVTDWYEFGWGDSFQLGAAQGRAGESFAERCRRHEYWFAHRAGIQKGQRWLDLGCGIGGPMRNIARFTEANIVGLNINMYQLSKAKALLKREGIEGLCTLLHCDFEDLAKSTKEGEYDGIYALEALCHAADLEKLFRDSFKALKPGSHFCCFEWMLTDKYDPKNEVHRRCKRAVEVFGAVAGMRTITEFRDAVKKAGFEILEEDTFDRQVQPHLYPEKWQDKFDPRASLLNFPISRVGIQMAYWFLVALEMLRIVPAGTSNTHKNICSNIPDVRLSGDLEIFTPHFFLKCKKPISQ